MRHASHGLPGNPGCFISGSGGHRGHQAGSVVADPCRTPGCQVHRSGMALGIELESAPFAPRTDGGKPTDVSAACPYWRAAAGAAMPHMQGDQAGICEALAGGAGIALGQSGNGPASGVHWRSVERSGRSRTVRFAGRSAQWCWPRSRSARRCCASRQRSSQPAASPPASSRSSRGNRERTAVR
jgi:hypothetical protein